jgi:hypothetical protein
MRPSRTREQRCRVRPQRSVRRLAKRCASVARCLRRSRRIVPSPAVQSREQQPPIPLRYPLCWWCNGELDGEEYTNVDTRGGEVIVHVDCADELDDDDDDFAS